MSWREYIITGFVTVAVIGAVAFAMHSSTASNTSLAHSLVNQSSLKKLEHTSKSSAYTGRLASGILPPTNMWLSGMVLQKTPKAVYPSPLSFLAKDSGFEIGLPTITSTATEIDGQHTPGITATLGANSFKLARYDKLSATLDYQNGATTLGSLTLSEGSPFVFYTASVNTTITLQNIDPSQILQQNAYYLRYRANNQIYAIYSPTRPITITQNSASISLRKGNMTTFYALPDNNDPLKQYAGNAIRSVDVSHVQSNDKATTIFTYKTANNRPTVFVRPAYRTSQDKDPIAQYDTIYGTANAFAGKKFTASVPTVHASDSITISHLTTDQKSQLTTTLNSDVATTKIDQQDSYYAGKQLARAANLLDIAEQLHQASAVNKLKDILSSAFASRLNGTYFYYDTTLKGIAATNAAFGSQDFNDHHFHYGYWLYAASILAKYDSDFLKHYKNQINLLAADIANYQDSNQFPQTRYYDPYAAHSWADGLAPFADGNDQESSSEAIHAWNGVTLWGQVTDNDELATMGQWMLANESYTAATTWRSIDTNSASLRNYSSPVVGIDYGGKRTYSTWFSDQPAAKLGIQLIPMDPSMTETFTKDGNMHIMQIIDASIQNNNYNVPLGDYILMYLSLANPQKAATLAKQQTNIDDGDSKTYMDAFIFSQLDK